MRTPFTERTQVQYTTNGSKVCTYKDATMAYCVTCQQPNRGTEVMAYLKRADAMRRLERVIAENGGINHA